MRYVRAVLWSTGHSSVILGIVLAAVALNAPFSQGLAFTYTMTTAAAVLLFAFRVPTSGGMPCSWGYSS